MVKQGLRMDSAESRDVEKDLRQQVARLFKLDDLTEHGVAETALDQAVEHRLDEFATFVGRRLKELYPDRFRFTGRWFGDV